MTGEGAGRGAHVAFCVLALALAVLLAAQAGSQLRWIGTKPFIGQPGFISVVGVAGMVLFGTFAVIGAWRRGRGGSALTPELLRWARALEYVGWFLLYVLAVPVIGYLPATLLFAVLLARRVGYRARRSLLAAAATALATVVIFKSLLAVKIPGGAIYEWLPRGAANFMAVHL